MTMDSFEQPTTAQHPITDTFAVVEEAVEEPIPSHPEAPGAYGDGLQLYSTTPQQDYIPRSPLDQADGGAAFRSTPPPPIFNEQPPQLGIESAASCTVALQMETAETTQEMHLAVVDGAGGAVVEAAPQEAVDE